MTKNRYVPLEDRVVIVPEKEQEQKTEGGLIDMSQKPTTTAVVFSAGEGRHAPQTGNWIPTVVKRGHRVLVGKDNGVPIQVQDEEGNKLEAKIMREGDILMVIESVE